MIPTFFQQSLNFKYSQPISFESLLESETKTFYLPLVVDTEFYHAPLTYSPSDLSRKRLQQTLTCQVKHIESDQRYIFTHPDSRAIARHPVMTTECIAFDWFKVQGFEVATKTIDQNYKWDKYDRELQIDLYAHFAVAELFRVFTGELRNQVAEMCNERAGKHVISQGRRVQTSNTLRASHAQQWVSFEKTRLWINGEPFRIRFCMWDTIAILGNQSLEKLAKLAGHELRFKSDLEQHEKENMVRVYLEKPEVFDNYAKGDLDVYDILMGCQDNLKRIHTELDLSDHWKEGESMRMTIGATVAKLFEGALMKHLGIKEVKTLRELTSHGNSETIKQEATTAKYLAKVDGGRCRNNRPTDVSIKKLMVDIDINGCYGNGLKNQMFPVGRPIIIGYPVESEKNKYMSLGEFIKMTKGDLVPGLWQARVSYKEGYKPKYGQDFLMSWYPPKNLDRMPTDTDNESVDWWTEDNVGISKVLTHDVNLALINHDYLQLIENICSVRQRRELLDNLVVISALYYPKSCKVAKPSNLQAEIKAHKGKNTVTVKGAKLKQVITNIQECHAWYGINLGELLVSELLRIRATKSKKIPEQAIFNELYKLIINTIYGDQVSPYFEIGNTCVGNNITARARCMAWYMEKGLYGVQTITDGCAFELNRVVHERGRKLTTETLFEVYVKGSHEGYYKLAPLGNESIEVKDWVKVESDNFKAKLFQGESELSYEDVADMTLKHLQSLFPVVDVLHKETNGVKGQYSLEIKNVVSGGSFHGSANYLFNERDDIFLKAKMRSYGKDKHKAITLINECLEIMRDDYKPATEFLSSLYQNPRSVKHSQVFVDSSILKIGSYKHLYVSRYEATQLFPGCTQERARLLRMFSLNQFTFRSFEQYRSWEREWKRLLDSTGHSYEAFFEDDGCIDVESMVKEVDRRIRNGDKGWFGGRGLSKYLERVSDGSRNHPAWKCLKRLQDYYGEFYGYAIPVEYGETDNVKDDE
jgi:hypothetical protein